MARVLMIDNYDSFTFNLVQYLREMGAEVMTHRNDALSIEDARSLEPTHLVISPGPGRPQSAGSTMAMIEAFAGELPMLGVCLGFQGIAAAWGAPIHHAARLMHGKPSDIEHDERGIFEGVSQHTAVGRYHSLGVHEGELHQDFIVTARETEGGELMAFRHRTLPIEAVQFHPESVLTPCGMQMMANFLGVRQDDHRSSRTADARVPSSEAS